MRLARLVIFASITVACTGCLSLHVTRPVEVTVLDTSTGKPVPDITVEAMYGYMFVLNAPRHRKTVTDSDGKAVLPLATFTDGIRHIYVDRLEVDRDVATSREERFRFPISAVFKPTGPVTCGRFTLNLRPVSWWAFYEGRSPAQPE